MDMQTDREANLLASPTLTAAIGPLFLSFFLSLLFVTEWSDNEYLNPSHFPSLHSSVLFFSSSFRAPISICFNPSNVISFKLLHCCELKGRSIDVCSCQKSCKTSGAGQGSTTIIRYNRPEFPEHWKRVVMFTSTDFASSHDKLFNNMPSERKLGESFCVAPCMTPALNLFCLRKRITTSISLCSLVK